jgi:lipopolysaccharide export system protein LptC
VAIGAATAQPDPSAPGRAMAEGLAARVDQPDGGWLRVTADQGVIDQGQARARLEGGVALETSTGFDIRTDAVTTRFDQTRVDTDGAVTADGPPGRVEAGQMSLRLDEQGAYVLDFTGGVRLVYTPPAADEGEP